MFVLSLLGVAIALVVVVYGLLHVPLLIHNSFVMAVFVVVVLPLLLLPISVGIYVCWEFGRLGHDNLGVLAILASLFASIFWCPYLFEIWGKFVEATCPYTITDKLIRRLKFRAPASHERCQIAAKQMVDFDEYDSPGDAIAVACRLDTRGEWNTAVEMYTYIAQRWPEQAEYMRNCIQAIDKKQSLT